MSDNAEEKRRLLRRRRSASRRKSIARFAERQRIKKRWIALIDLIAWCAQSTTAASNDEEARARDVAYRRLAESILRGEFEQSGRSKVLYLDTLVTSDGASSRCRLTRNQFKITFDVAAMPPAPSLPLTVLNCCWLPSDIARRWLESHGYRWAPHFEPAHERRPAQAIPDFDLRLGWIPLANALAQHGNKSRGEKSRSVPPSREKAFWPAARVAACEWLTENGCPAPSDGNQAELERWLTKWLEDRGHEASESTVRRHVARCIKERRAEPSA